jgi:hypothetical protein
MSNLDGSLWIGHNKIDLTKGPTENDTEDYHKPDGEPCHNKCVGLEIAHSVDLLSAMEVQSCLVRLDLVCCETHACVTLILLRV